MVKHRTVHYSQLPLGTCELSSFTFTHLVFSQLLLALRQEHYFTVETTRNWSVCFNAITSTRTELEEWKLRASNAQRNALGLSFSLLPIFTFPK